MGLNTCASANEISVSLTTQTLTEESINLTVLIENIGGDSIFNIEAFPLTSTIFSINGSLFLENLNPGASHEEIFSIFLNKSILPGKYPIVFLVTYYDKMYDKYTLYAKHLLTYVDGFDSLIAGSLNNLNLDKNQEGTLNIIVSNLENNYKEIDVNLYLSEEFKTTTKNITLIADSINNYFVNFIVKAPEFPSGEEYATLASLEYDLGGYHYCTFAESNIVVFQQNEIEEKSNILIIFVLIYVALLMIYIYLKFGGKK